VKKCIECGAESKPEQVIDSVQIYECTNGHRWGIVNDIKEEDIKIVKAA
jgi:hypothetical protein